MKYGKTLFKVATTEVNLLFIELMSHLSHVNQMHSQPIRISLLSCYCVYNSQVEREAFNVDSSEKSLLALHPFLSQLSDVASPRGTGSSTHDCKDLMREKAQHLVGF